MLSRHEQLDRWVFSNRPKVFWFTGFFNPQGFLTSMQQEVARNHSGWALDDVVLQTEVLKQGGEGSSGHDEVKEPPAEGVYIHGLNLEGCAWSKKENKLIDSQPKKLYWDLPVLFVTAVLGSERKADQGYNCPVYKVKKRTDLNYIFTCRLRCEEN